MNVKKIAKKWEKTVDFVAKYVKMAVLAVCWLLYATFAPIHKNIKPAVIKIVDYVNGKKTYITSLVAIIGLFWSYHKGIVDLQGMLTTLPMLVLAMTFRHGMARHAVPSLEGGTKQCECEQCCAHRTTPPTA
jgi:hypothetical protein